MDRVRIPLRLPAAVGTKKTLETNMDLEKIKKLIEFVGSSRVSELTVSQAGTTVRIIRENNAVSQHATSSQPRIVPVAEAAPDDAGGRRCRCGGFRCLFFGAGCLVGCRFRHRNDAGLR